MNAFIARNGDNISPSSAEFRRLHTSATRVQRHLKKLRSVGQASVALSIAYSGSGATYSPNTLYQTRSFEHDCSTSLNFDIVPDVTFLPVEHITNVSSFISNLRDLPYGPMLDFLSKNLTMFVSCMSEYKHFIQEVKTWYDATRLAMTPGIAINYETIAQLVISDRDLVTTLITELAKGQLSIRTLGEVMTEDATRSMVLNLESVKDVIHQDVVKVLFWHIDNQHLQLIDVYTSMLTYLNKFQSYFSMHPGHFLDQARQLELWRQPQATPDGTHHFNFTIDRDDIWKTWPEFMDISFFVENQLPLFFEAFGMIYHDILEEQIYDTDLLTQGLRDDIEKSMRELLLIVQPFKKSADEQLILLSTGFIWKHTCLSKRPPFCRWGFKGISFNENFWISNLFSLRYILMV